MQYTVRAAMLATGVSGDRFQTWERRYGVIALAHSNSGRRRYDDGNLAVLRRS
ncbi:MAG: MerR family transcriptional regulator [Dehalococcoidia bacterium]|nr:MerR family transcriptional regulator [Dehalococcoidia bacterium]